MHQKFIVWIAAFLLLSMAACDDYVDNSGIPEANVFIEINLSNVEWTEAGLNSPYNAVVVTDVCENCWSYTGYLGVIVMRDQAGNYYAFEQCCTVDPETNPHAVEVSGMVATCPEDDSQFLLNEGYNEVAKGSAAKYPLRMYKTRKVGNTLTIYN